MQVGALDPGRVPSIQTALAVTGAPGDGTVMAVTLGGRWGGASLNLLAARVDGFRAPPFRPGPGPVARRALLKAGWAPAAALEPRIGLELSRDSLVGGGHASAILASLGIRLDDLRLTGEASRRASWRRQRPGPVLREENLVLAWDLRLPRVSGPAARVEARCNLDGLRPFLKAVAFTWDSERRGPWGLQAGASFRPGGGEPGGFLTVFRWSAATGVGLKASYAPKQRLGLELGVKLCFGWERRAGTWARKDGGRGPL
jgi:hypothetical protein